MRTLFRFIITVVCTFLMACSDQPSTSPALTNNAKAPISTAKAPASYLHWTSSELIGTTFQLIDNQRIENMTFYANGYLTMTLGVKTENGPMIMAPIFYWSIDSDGALIILDNKKNTYEKIYKIAIDDNRITAQVNGKTQQYDMIKLK